MSGGEGWGSVKRPSLEAVERGPITLMEESPEDRTQRKVEEGVGGLGTRRILERGSEGTSFWRSLRSTASPVSDLQLRETPGPGSGCDSVWVEVR